MKRYIALLLVAATMLGMCGSFSGCTNNKNCLTRSQWITELADRFGMDSTVSEEPYFLDVKQDQDYYNYVQSCADWGVISNEGSKKFEPNQDATVDFALETALKAAGVDLGDKSFVDYALANGIIKDKSFKSVRSRLTQEVAEQIIDWTQDIYINGDVAPREIVEFNEAVRNLNNEKDIQKEDEDTYAVSGDMAQSLEEGDLLLMPSDEFPDGVAVKVRSVTIQPDGTAMIDTIEPEIEEILKDLDVAKNVGFQQEDIQLAPGVTFAGGVTGIAAETDGTIRATTLRNCGTGDANVVNLSNGIIPDINLNVNFTKGTISLSPEWQTALGETLSLGGEKKYAATDPNNPNSEGEQKGAGVFTEKTSVIPVGSDHGKDAFKNQMAINAYKDGQISLDELKKELDLTKNQEEKKPKTMENKFKAGYEVVGGLSITNIKITTEAKYSVLTGIKASLKVDYTATFSGGVKGYLSESLNLMTVRVPVATGVTVDVKFYLCLDANGEIMVKVTMDNSTKYSIDGLNVKKSTTLGKPEITREFNATVDFGPKIALELCVAGYPLVDVGIKAVVRGKVSAKANYQTTYTTGVNEENRETITIERKSLWTVRADAYLPIIILEANVNPKSVANKLKLTGSWTLIGEAKAKHFGPEKDPEPIVIWSEELTLIGDVKQEEETTENTEATKETEVNNIGEQLIIDVYFLELEKGQSASVKVVSLPKGYKAADLVWSSSNEDVATVSGGKIKAIANGSTTITVRTADGKFTQQCSVTVGQELNQADAPATNIDYYFGIPDESVFFTGEPVAA